MPPMAFGIVGLCGLLVMSMTNSLLAGCVGLLLSLLYQHHTVRLASETAATAETATSAVDRGVPRWDRRALPSSESERTDDAQPEHAKHEEEGMAGGTGALVRVGPARQSTTVLVASRNAVKLEAVRCAFEAWFGGTVEVRGVEADSGIPHGQPFGMQHTYEGCAARMQQLLASAGGAGGPWPPDFLVAVENGVVPVVTHTATFGHDVACVMVSDVASQRTRHAFSQSRPYPLSIVQEMARQGMSGGEVGAFCAAHYEKMELTCTRDEQIRSCTRLVLSELLPPGG